MGETNLAIKESTCLGVQVKVPGRLLVRLNTTVRPIGNKYREGKLKNTLKRELKRSSPANGCIRTGTDPGNPTV